MLISIRLSAGTIVEAYSPRGDRAGCVEVMTSGYYPYLRVYRADPDAVLPIPGMQAGDEVTFKVKGSVADLDPTPVIWTDDRVLIPVNLTATSVPCYALDRSGAVDVGDFDVMDDFWRATDAAALAFYDSNNNGVVDVGDFVKLGMHLGEPCRSQMT